MVLYSILLSPVLPTTTEHNLTIDPALSNNKRSLSTPPRKNATITHTAQNGSSWRTHAPRLYIYTRHSLPTTHRTAATYPEHLLDSRSSHSFSGRTPVRCLLVSHRLRPCSPADLISDLQVNPACHAIPRAPPPHYPSGTACPAPLPPPR